MLGINSNSLLITSCRSSVSCKMYGYVFKGDCFDLKLLPPFSKRNTHGRISVSESKLVPMEGGGANLLLKELLSLEK